MKETEKKRLEIMSYILEFTELQGQAKLNILHTLNKLQKNHRIAPVIIDLLRSDDLGYNHRQAAAVILADWREEGVIPVLLEFIETGIEGLQEVALSSLYRFGDPIGIDLLIKLLDEDDRNLNKRICDYLGTCKLIKVVPPLIQVLNRKGSELRYHAILALSQNGSNEAFNALENHLKKENDPELKALIQKLLKHIK